jgi:hypothetical protein
MRFPDRLRTPVWRYMVIGVLTFTLGSASAVFAASSGALTVPRFSLADGTNPDQLAKVDADGSVHVTVSNQPSTQQVSGTVSVNNFPATQNVSGTVRTTPSLATKTVNRFFGPLDPGEDQTSTFPTINASLINVTSISGDIEVRVRGPIGTVFDAFLGDNEVHALTLTQQVPIDAIDVSCTNVILPCAAHVMIAGD